ncbi:MAG TPA: hypothetical protein VHO70_11400 [Chitinispirillaceae bacterium]|nr:hypothetical protein [Chitinispirillaceae bacterium]
MDIKKVVLLLCIFILGGCIFHDNCFRDFSGKINFISTNKDAAVVVSKHYYASTEWKYFDTVIVNKNQNSYNIHWAEHRPQTTCHNDCPNGNGTMADSIRIKIFNTSDDDESRDLIVP